jgi:alkylhydroperoxidase/carboxymuconolactone decarboxylase family protein YurZ
MEDVHKIFSEFKKEFPEIHEKHAALGEEVHRKGGPLPEKTRWLIKIAISAASNHKRALGRLSGFYEVLCGVKKLKIVKLVKPSPFLGR